jgi:hypothetical protein
MCTPFPARCQLTSAVWKPAPMSDASAPLATAAVGTVPLFSHVSRSSRPARGAQAGADPIAGCRKGTRKGSMSSALWADTRELTPLGIPELARRPRFTHPPNHFLPVRRLPANQGLSIIGTGPSLVAGPARVRSRGHHRHRFSSRPTECLTVTAAQHRLAASRCSASSLRTIPCLPEPMRFTECRPLRSRLANVGSRPVRRRLPQPLSPR